VADFTYVATWSGAVDVAFVLDCHSRRILGWRAATSMRTDLVLDALEQTIWTRTREGVTDLSGLVCHNDAGSIHLDRLHRTAGRRRCGTQRRRGRRRAGQPLAESHFGCSRPS
jgi:putative transposase